MQRIKVGIVGGREFPSLGLVKSFVEAMPEGANVVSGGARGVDSVAEQAAKQRGWQPEIKHAIFQKGAPRGEVVAALFARNSKIVEASDVVVAFWDGLSAGTRDTITKAKNANKRVFIIGPDGSSMTRDAALLHIKHVVSEAKNA